MIPIYGELSLVYTRASITVRQKAVEARTSIYYIENDQWIEDSWERCEHFISSHNPLHNHIVTHNSVTDIPSMTVFAGCNGAGKSTLIESFSNEQLIINPDIFAGGLWCLIIFLRKI